MFLTRNFHWKSDGASCCREINLMKSEKQPLNKLDYTLNLDYLFEMLASATNFDNG